MILGKALDPPLPRLSSSLGYQQPQKIEQFSCEKNCNNSHSDISLLLWSLCAGLPIVATMPRCQENSLCFCNVADIDCLVCPFDAWVMGITSQISSSLLLCCSHSCLCSVLNALLSTFVLYCSGQLWQRLSWYHGWTINVTTVLKAPNYDLYWFTQTACKRQWGHVCMSAWWQFWWHDVRSLREMACPQTLGCPCPPLPFCHSVDWTTSVSIIIPFFFSNCLILEHPMHTCLRYQISRNKWR